MWGIGSILGIIFGFVALASIKKSGGVEKGRGLAIAGISVGFGGIVLGIGAVIGLIVLVTHFVHENTVPMGTTVNLSNCGCGSSLSTLRVASLEEVPASVVPASPSGNRLWVAKIDACEVANPSQTGADGPEFYNLSATTTDGGSYSPVDQLPPGKKSILYSSLQPGGCAHGYVSFWIPSGQTAVGVEYTPDGPFSRYEWKQP